jgi:hypothetical protein
MERTQIFELMSDLRLYGMKAAYDADRFPSRARLAHRRGRRLARQRA